MPISLGDAVLIFKGDQTDLNAAFAAVPANAQKSFGAAAEYVNEFNTELDATGDNVRFAGEQIMSLSQAFRTLSVTGPERLKQKLDDARAAFATLQEAGVTAKGTLLQATIKVTERELAYRKAVGDSTEALDKQLEKLQQQYAQLGKGDAPEKLSHGFHEARGAVDLLSEGIGITIPRELKALISSLPGVSQALEAAFLPTALFAAIALVVELMNKWDEYKQQQREIQQGYEEFRTTAVENLRRIDDQIDEQRQHYIELTRGPVAAYDYALQHLKGTADETFSGIRSEVDQVKAQFDKAGTGSILHPFTKDAKKDIEEFLLSMQQVKREAQTEVPGDALAPYTRQLEVTANAIDAITRKIATLREQGASDEQIKDYRVELELLQDVNRELNRSVDFLNERAKAEKQARDAAAAQEGVQQAQQALQRQLANLELFKAKQHEAFEKGRIDAIDWALAQKKAADDAALAQEHYLSRVVAVYQKAGDAQKTQQATADLRVQQTKDQTTQLESQNAALEAVNSGLRANQAAVLQSLQGWRQFENLQIDRAFEGIVKGVDAANQSLNRLREAQTRLAEAKTSADYAQQIQAIEARAEAGVTSELDATEQLRNIYQAQEIQQLQHLQVMLAQQKEAAAQAQQKLDVNKDNPFFPADQLADLQKNLNEALVAIENTNTQIVNVRAAADAQVEKLDRKLLKLATGDWENFFRLVFRGSFTAANALKTFAQLSAQAIGASVEAALLGSKGFGAAMAEMLKSLLAAEAGKAAIRVVDELAEGFSALASPWPDIQRTAPQHFLAAAKWGAVLAATTIGAALVPSGGGGGPGGSPGAPPNLPPSPATTPQTPGPTTTNVRHLYAGGLITQPTLAIVGDSRNRGGGAREAVLPLDDARAMDAISSAVADRLRSDIALPNPPDFMQALADLFGNSGLVQHFHIKGDVVDHTRLMRQQSRLVKKGRARSTASDAFRVTRRV